MADASNELQAGVAEQAVASAVEIERLKLSQREALNSLCNGVSITDTARLVGIARASIYNWLNSDGAFAAIYNQWLDEMEHSCRSRLSAMTDKAASAIEHALEKKDAKAAIQLLKGLGLMKARKERAIDADEIERRWKLESKRRKIQLEKDERGAVLNDLSSRETDQLGMEMTEGFKPEDWVQTEKKIVGGEVKGTWVKKGDEMVEKLAKAMKGKG